MIYKKSKQLKRYMTKEGHKQNSQLHLIQTLPEGVETSISLYFHIS